MPPSDNKQALRDFVAWLYDQRLCICGMFAGYDYSPVSSTEKLLDAYLEAQSAEPQPKEKQ